MHQHPEKAGLMMNQCLAAMQPGCEKDEISKLEKRGHQLWILVNGMTVRQIDHNPGIQSSIFNGSCRVNPYYTTWCFLKQDKNWWLDFQGYCAYNYANYMSLYSRTCCQRAATGMPPSCQILFSATPITSRPLSPAGHAWAWIGVGLE